MPYSALTYRGFATVPGCPLIPVPSLVTRLGHADTAEKVPINVRALPCGVPQSNAVGAASQGRGCSVGYKHPVRLGLPRAGSPSMHGGCRHLCGTLGLAVKELTLPDLE